ncbi:MAG: NUDIX hydrolase [Propionibacteriaceae bacterium]|nr:NUDIX hydrolase [Propionibacteriaceae bacterium]
MDQQRAPEEDWATCARGEQHWGRLGGAGVAAWLPDGRVLLQLRSGRSHHGGTWGWPGGARRRGETALAAAVREAGEETPLDTSVLQPRWWHLADHGGWTYTTVGAAAPAAQADLAPDGAHWETDDLRWIADPAALDLHPGVAEAWPALAPLVGAQATLVVDAANVVGSRPDGWWKDRAGAATRLRDELAALARTGLAHIRFDPRDQLGLAVAGWWPRLVLVTEGQARGVTSTPDVTVVPAPAAGDDEIVRQAALALDTRPTPTSPVAVVTADRELIRRVAALGATTLRPSAIR